jgi:hypothetical protein
MRKLSPQKLRNSSYSAYPQYIRAVCRGRVDKLYPPRGNYCAISF